VAHFLGQVETERIDIGDDNVACPGVAGDRGCHYADRAGTGDKNILAEYFKSESSVNGVSKWVVHCRDFQINIRFMLPDIRHRHSDIFGETAVGIHTNSTRVRAEPATSRHTVSTAAANQMAFDAYDIAGCKIKHIRADIDDLPDKLVADSRGYFYRRLCPRVPIVNVKICAANATFFRADHYVVDAHLGLRTVFYPEARLGFAFNNSFHSIL
jgi:hypothetical protein